MLNNEETQQRLDASPNPRVTEAIINSKIQYHQFVYVGLLTICVITLETGFTVTGESACVDAGNYDREIGEKYAYSSAFGKIWQLEGYLLANHLQYGVGMANSTDIPPDSMGAPIYKGQQ